MWAIVTTYFRYLVFHTVFWYLHLSLFMWLIDYINFDHMCPFSQPHLLSLIQSQTSQELSMLSVCICLPPAYHSTYFIWPMVSLISLLKAAAVTSRSLKQCAFFGLWLLSSIQYRGLHAAVIPQVFFHSTLGLMLFFVGLLSLTMNTESPSRPCLDPLLTLSLSPGWFHACLCFQL